MRVSAMHLTIILISILELLVPNFLLSQDIVGNESLAIEYFKGGDYEKALPIFTRLFNHSPDNAMYNYYYGVSLLKNNRLTQPQRKLYLTLL